VREGGKTASSRIEPKTGFRYIRNWRRLMAIFFPPIASSRRASAGGSPGGIAASAAALNG